MTGSHTPVLSSVDAADELLDISKTMAGSETLPIINASVSNGLPKKDRISVFETTMNWTEFETALKEAKNLLGWLRGGTVNTAQVHRLLRFSRMQRKFIETRKTRYLEYAPLLVRDIRRNWEKGEPANWAMTLTDQNAQGMARLQFVCEYALNGIRNKEKGEE
jgi:hypothetical protein